MNQVLTCAGCNKSWGRKGQRGRKPKFCPACASAPRSNAIDALQHVLAQTEDAETLTCQHDGHTWTRIKARGRKPPLCPEHRFGPAPDVVTVGDDPVKRPSGLPSVNVHHPAVQAVLNGPVTELQRKLTYTVAELENPKAWREQGDWTNLIETHRRLIIDAERATVTTPTTTEN